MGSEQSITNWLEEEDVEMNDTLSSQQNGPKPLEQVVYTKGATDHIGLQMLALEEPEEEGENGEERYYCHICLSQSRKSRGYQLPCSHEYCQVCLESYLQSKISEANTTIRCFHPLHTASPPSDSTTSPSAVDNSSPAPTTSLDEDTAIPPEVHDPLASDTPTESPVASPQPSAIACEAEISETTILDILRNNSVVAAKYTRFKYMSDHSDARECPKCNQFTSPDDTAPRMCCTNLACLTEFCFTHADAHTFSGGRPPALCCADYEATCQRLDKDSFDLIAASTKPCPGCAMKISKNGGCNHMKCPHCEQAFCWLCLEPIGTEVFPAHFQWWNAASPCANLQMDDAEVPTESTRSAATFWMVIQMIVLGPLSVVCTALTLLVFGCCVPRVRLREFLANCMSNWGMFWMFMLVLLPLCSVVLGFGLAIFLMCLLIVPFYHLVSYVMKRNTGTANSSLLDLAQRWVFLGPPPINSGGVVVPPVDLEAQAELEASFGPRPSLLLGRRASGGRGNALGDAGRGISSVAAAVNQRRPSFSTAADV